MLFAAQARDMLPPPKTAPTTFIAHHAAVMTTVFLAFYLTGAFRRALRGRSGRSAGSPRPRPRPRPRRPNRRRVQRVRVHELRARVGLDVGSRLHSLPDVRGARRAYHAMMAGSSAFGLVGGAWFVFNRSAARSSARGVYGVITVGVVIGRQHHALRTTAPRARRSKAH